MKLPRILIADDHTLFIEGIRKLLEGEVELAGSAKDGRALIAAAEQLRPDIVLLDISMPLLNGLDAARQLQKILPETKLVFLTMHADPAYVAEAFRAGASGYLLKSSAGEELLQALQEVMRGHTFITSALPPEVLDAVTRLTGEHRNHASSDLTAREREVLQLVAEGHSAKEIGTLLHVSPRTVEFHKYRVMRKLGLRTTAQLASYAVQRGNLGL